MDDAERSRGQLIIRARVSGSEAELCLLSFDNEVGAGEAITSYQLSLNTLIVYKCLQRSVWIFELCQLSGSYLIVMKCLFGSRT